MSTLSRIEELEKKYAESPRRFFAPLANEYRKAGNARRAVELCRKHLEQHPSHMSGQVVLGQALYDSDLKAEAQLAFEAALALDPENLIALRHLGDMARDRGSYQEARGWFLRMQDVDPRNPETTALLRELDDVMAASRDEAAMQHSGDTAGASPQPSTTSFEGGWQAGTDDTLAGWSDSAAAETAETAELPEQSTADLSAAGEEIAGVPGEGSGGDEVEVALVADGWFDTLSLAADETGTPVAEVPAVDEPAGGEWPAPEALAARDDALPGGGDGASADSGKGAEPVVEARGDMAAELVTGSGFWSAFESEGGDRGTEETASVANEFYAAAAGAEVEVSDAGEPSDSDIKSTDASEAVSKEEVPAENEGMATAELRSEGAAIAPALPGTFWANGGSELFEPHPEGEGVSGAASTEAVKGGDSPSHVEAETAFAPEGIAADAAPVADDVRGVGGLGGGGTSDVPEAPSEGASLLDGDDSLEWEMEVLAAGVPASDSGVEEGWLNGFDIADSGAAAALEVDGEAISDAFAWSDEQGESAEGVETAQELSQMELVEEGVAAQGGVRSSSSVFITETMAALYEEQGYLEMAMAVYRQLMERHPESESLRGKLSDLEDRLSQGRRERTMARRGIADSEEETARAFFAGLVRVPLRARLARPYVAGKGAEPSMGEGSALGEPARAASAPLSLDSVFRSGTGRATGNYTFENFFTPTSIPAAGAEVAGKEQRAVRSRRAEASEEVEQFNAWLEGLKRT